MDTDDLATTLADAALALARVRGDPQPERRDAWIERLRVNLAELEALARLPASSADCGDGYLVPRPARLAPRLEVSDAPPRLPSAAERPALAERDGVASERADDGNALAASPLAASAIAARSLAVEHSDLHAFTQLASIAQIEDAAAQRRRAWPGAAVGPLTGTPIAVKDLMQVQGFAQTNGSGGMPRVVALRDATAIARLRDAGAIVVGTTNLHEYAYGITSENPHFGAVVNPRARERLPGGSSGGSAAAVAAGIVPIAVGTDTAGSIRIPAACCGVVGFKPSFDAVPREGVQTLSASLDHVGPIAASVADAGLAFAIMADESVRPLRAASLAGIRIGVPRRHFFELLDEDVAACASRALDRIRADGAQLVDVSVDGIESAAAIQFATICIEASDALGHLLDPPALLGADVRVRIEIGQCLPATWYVRAQRARATLAAGFDSALREVDVVVTPTLRVMPPLRGAREVRAGERMLPLHTAMTALTMPFNLCGMPALTVPAASRDQHLPGAIQIAGRRGDDWRVLEIGARIAELIAG